MARTFLTDTKIKTLKHAEKEYSISDGNNLYIFVSRTSKIWQFIYSHPTTKKRVKKNIGKYPATSLARAREKALDFLSLLDDGLDPFEYAQEQAEKERKNAITVRQMAEIWKDRKQREILPKTYKDLCERLERWLFPIFGNELIKNIRLPQAIEGLEPLYKAHPDTARKIAGWFVNILDRAVVLGYLNYNPIQNLKKEFYKVPVTHQAAIPYKELPAFLKALYLSNRQTKTKLLIEWQLLTMVRPAEAVSVEWTEIDFVKKIWNIPAHKMKGKKDMKKPHSVPLSAQALEVLSEMKKYCIGSPFVFSHRMKPCAHFSSETANNAIKSIGDYKGRLTSHGLRAIARTYMAENGIDFIIAESCLAHVTGTGSSIPYIRTEYEDLRREAMQKWGDYVEQCKRF